MEEVKGMKKFEIVEFKSNKNVVTLYINDEDLGQTSIILNEDERRELENVLISYNQKKIMEKNNIK
jgi:hypothetical protein